jgi:hypothetical protein
MDARVMNVSEHLTQSVYNYTCMGLFENRNHLPCPPYT